MQDWCTRILTFVENLDNQSPALTAIKNRNAQNPAQRPLVQQIVPLQNQIIIKIYSRYMIIQDPCLIL